MKIVAGEYKYRKIEIPEGIRPTTEKVREAVFSMINFSVPGAKVLDLFAGSGSLGLEALSRGADICWFNEGDRANFRVLKRNSENCKAGDRAVLYNHDFRKCLSLLTEKPDIVFLDPPYRSGFYEEAFRLLEENDLVKEGMIVVAEHLYDNKLSDSYGRLVKINEKKYGTIGVDLFEAR